MKKNTTLFSLGGAGKSTPGITVASILLHWRTLVQIYRKRKTRENTE